MPPFTLPPVDPEEQARRDANVARINKITAEAKARLQEEERKVKKITTDAQLTVSPKVLPSNPVKRWDQKLDDTPELEVIRNPDGTVSHQIKRST